MRAWGESAQGHGTYFDPGTDPRLARALETCRRDGRKVRLVLGDTGTGASWLDEFDVVGTVGRSTGLLKVPCSSSRARRRHGHPLCACAGTDGLGHRPALYRHPRWQPPELRIRASDDDDRPWAVVLHEQPVATFDDIGKAGAYLAFMRGAKRRAARVPLSRPVERSRPFRRRDPDPLQAVTQHAPGPAPGAFLFRTANGATGAQRPVRDCTSRSISQCRKRVSSVAPVVGLASADVGLQVRDAADGPRLDGGDAGQPRPFGSGQSKLVSGAQHVGSALSGSRASSRACAGLCTSAAARGEEISAVTAECLCGVTFAVCPPGHPGRPWPSHNGAASAVRSCEPCHLPAHRCPTKASDPGALCAGKRGKGAVAGTAPVESPAPMAQT